MGPQLRSRLAIAGLTLGTGAVALVGVGAWWVRRCPERLAEATREWATARVLAASDSVYHLTFGRFSYDAATRSIRLDSLRLDTDTARNARRPRPLPTLSATARDGRFDDIVVPLLARGRHRTLAIGVISFARLDAEIVLPSRDEGPAQAPAPAPAPAPATATSSRVRQAKAERTPEPSAAGRQSDGLEWRPGIALAPDAPTVRVARVELPRVSVRIRRASSRDDPGQVAPQLALWLDRLEVAPANGRIARVRLRDLRLRAERYSGGWDSLSSVAIASVQVSAADSLLRVDSVEVRPTRALADERRQRRWRHTRLAASIPAIEARGVDYGAMLQSGAAIARIVEIAAPRLDLLMDRYRGPDPRQRPARLPHEIMRKLPVRISVDSVSVAGGVISYGELAPWQPQPGVVTFEHLHGSIVNLSNDSARMSDERPMVLTAAADLMGSGRFFTRLEIPLLADRFRMRYRGTLGPMPLAEFNRFTALNTPAKVRQGDVIGLAFDARVADGRATGRLIPRYRDLKVGATGRGGGLLAKVGRHIGSFLVNHFKLRTDNPSDDGRGQLVVGRIDREHRASEGLFPFLWYTLRDALTPVMAK